MRKRDKEVLKHLLREEDGTLKSLEKAYRQALSEIDERIAILRADEMTQSKIYQLKYQRALRSQVERILDKLQGSAYRTVDDYLHTCYRDGFVGTMYALHGQKLPILAPIDKNAVEKAVRLDSQLSESLYETMRVDMRKLKRAIRTEISVGISTGKTFDEMARSIQRLTNVPLNRTKTIVRTEGHRIQQASAADARNEAKRQGCDVLKQWDSTLDGNTRASHRALDGQIRETNEPFEIDGKQADRPGEFGRPEEDCNCRCVALTRARWGLGKEELDTLQERAKFFSLDKEDGFREFREKYLRAADGLKKQGNGGIIGLESSIVKDALSSGTVTTKINQQKQERHIKASAGYIKGRSYIYGTLQDAQLLVDTLAGTGMPVRDSNGNWINKERVRSSKPIGVFVDKNTMMETESTKAMIVYSRTGTHIYPRPEDEE